MCGWVDECVYVCMWGPGGRGGECDCVFVTVCGWLGECVCVCVSPSLSPSLSVSLYCPDMTFAFDWVLKNNYLSIYYSLSLSLSLFSHFCIASFT